MVRVPARSLIIAACFALVHAADTDSSTGEKRVIAGFKPSLALAVVGLVLFGLVTVVHWIHFFRNGLKRYMLTLTIGMTCMTVGFVMRIIYAGNDTSLGLYILQTMFILLSPCAFLANDYVLLCRLANAFGPDVADQALLIRPSRIVKIFVWSDVITFWLQACGGGMSAASGSIASLGHDVALVGLVLQLVSFGLFTALLVVFGFRIRRLSLNMRTMITPLHLGRYRVWSKDPVSDWRLLWVVLALTCIGILIRSTFRIVEYAQGYSGYLATHEGYFYALDALPLLLSMATFTYVWPTRVIDGAARLDSSDAFASPYGGGEFKLGEWQPREE
ncbi:hypothetical protein JCM1840_005010 [Sporobolomyces johnsonii]